MSYSLISVILPARDQAGHIAAVVNGYESALTALGTAHELLLVPNGCRDSTPGICRTLADQHAAVRVVEGSPGGWGAAVRTGLVAAQGDLLAYTNCARTSAADLLLVLKYACANPNNAIKANRKVRDSWRRRLGSLIYNLQCRLLFDLPYWDINGTPKVFPRSFDRLLRLSRNDDLIDAEFAAIVARERYPLIEIPILSTVRHGRSTTNYRSALNMYWGAYRMARDDSSLRP